MSYSAGLTTCKGYLMILHAKNNYENLQFMDFFAIMSYFYFKNRQTYQININKETNPFLICKILSQLFFRRVNFVQKLNENLFLFKYILTHSRNYKACIQKKS